MHENLVFTFEWKFQFFLLDLKSMEIIIGLKEQILI